MSAAEFKREMAEAFKGRGFSRGERVMVNGRIGTVHTKLIHNGGISQSVRFDDGSSGLFPASDLMAVVDDNSRPTEIDRLGQAIRRT